MKLIKILIFVTTFTLGTLVLACPHIDGKFKQTFPAGTGAQLQISSHFEDGNKIFHLVMPSQRGPTWSWKSNVGSDPKPKDLGSFYKNVYEVAECTDRQLKVRTYGELIDGEKVIRFHQEWRLYRGTLGNLRWQINYNDDTLAEPLLSVFGYEQAE